MELGKSLDELKTSIVGGYSKGAVQDLIEKIILECQEDNQKEVADLKTQNSRLEAENRGYKERNELLSVQFEELSKSMQKMTTAMEKEADYKQTRDRELEAFYRKEEELNHGLDRVRSEAEAEKNRILKEAEQERENLLKEARDEHDRILKSAEEEQKSLLLEAREELGRLLEHSAQIRMTLEKWKGKVEDLFSWSDENLKVAPTNDPQVEVAEQNQSIDSEMVIGADEN